jgi:hypothetical protein
MVRANFGQPKTSDISASTVDRAFEIVPKASRHLPDDQKARHPELP